MQAATTDELYRTARTSVQRRWNDDRTTTIRKVLSGPGAARRAAQEKALLERLAGVAGVSQTTDEPVGVDTVAMVDVGGVTLRARPMPLAVEPAITLMTQLIEIVAEVHRRGVVHKDINPDNILIDRSGRPVLIDFDIASTFAQEQPGFVHENEIAGTLPYLAPEQTGRTGRLVDQRADLYGLGTTMYELLTGRPPFGSADRDPLELLHDHLARVPARPDQVEPAVPAVLADVVMRLLAKEPDQRYQSADGVLHDLRRIRDGDLSAFPLGERDFPQRIAPPSRLVGRETEIAALHTAFDECLVGRARGVLVSGAPGVGKTALIDELRTVATVGGGWLVSGKFDQYRRDTGADAMWQALGGIARFLLAEPEQTLSTVRADLLRALGVNAGILAAQLPQFQALLDVEPEHSLADPAKTQPRLVQTALELLRVVAHPAQPVVIVVDDLQWAGAPTIDLIDALLLDAGLRGVLLVGAYRQAEVDQTHPLAAMFSRWENSTLAPRQLRLENLRPVDQCVLVGDILRLEPQQAQRLAVEIDTRAHGNPFDTVELINALRTDGILLCDEHGWHWDPAELRGHVRDGDVLDVLTARIDRLPATTGELLTIMACLGGEVGLRVLVAAAARPGTDVEADLQPALEDGLLVMSREDETLRFRHDRIQQAAFARGAAALHLPVARRLLAEPGLAGLAAEQYLAADAAFEDGAERARVALLYWEAAGGARLSSNQVLRERYLRAAQSLVDATDTETLADLVAEHHAVLYTLGRLDEADDAFAWLSRHRPEPLANADSVCLQIASLTIRLRPHDAVTLGLTALRGLGLGLPTPERLDAEIDDGIDGLYRWLAGSTVEEEMRRPEPTDPLLRAQARIFNRTIPPAFFSGQIPVMAWMVGRAAGMWAAHGPSAALVGPLAHIGFVIIPMRDDHAAANQALGRVLAVSEDRGWEPDTSQCRFLFALTCGHWVQPLEQSLRQARLAREGLIRAGEQLNAAFTFYVTAPNALDCTPTIEGFRTVIDDAISFASRTGNDHIATMLLPYRQIVRALCGQTESGLDDSSFRHTTYLTEMAPNPTAVGFHQIVRGVLGLITGDLALVADAIAGARKVEDYAEVNYVKVLSGLLLGIDCAERLRRSDSPSPGLLAELDRQRAWMSARAAQIPENTLHLAHLLDAERAWAVGDLAAAIAGYDAAREAVNQVERPWHRAVIAGRAAEFHTAHGAPLLALHLRAECWRTLTRWGATGVAARLAADWPAVADVDRTATASSSRADSLDLLAVVRAGQALSGETDLTRLRERVGDVLGALAGADRVLMAVPDETTGDWLLPDPGGVPISLAEAGARGLLPLAAVRYAQRTGEPLTIDDVTSHELCTRERYVDTHQRSSLLIVPIISHGTQRAMLVLENSLARGAFTVSRLEAVQLIAGQLTVAIDNALLYASLERKVAERTEALEHANHQLEVLTVTDALTGLFNRRHLEDSLETEWRRRLRSGLPLAIAMLDVDHFKRYNDEYGHQAGDECLRRVAATIGANIRSTDIAARYGGEEFCIVMADTDLDAAVVAAERVRFTVAALDIEHSGSLSGRVTVSIGVAAEVPRPDALPEFLLKAADTALYDAKNGGRDRVARH
ncbi:diguanylate cyclase [Actinoplanes derwentensis]|uniref:Diguanylate cyclase (GGDEF) domain-containing protein n=1 Tax=Actinoplanes derwentensis TaxID=113562 RepID=A0A1H1YGE4_9ACTN|nr:diguanylate cyclase [Actinoplanes derwentensis]GID81133.1 serine/threonine protein kinase [Actinoplanes derwentensis]SDT20464.1 diguanylate cyclase (GGDEF) domain-containing protein [Actinoplanes derwentensis]